MSHWCRKREESTMMLNKILSRSDGASSFGPKRTAILSAIQSTASTLQNHFKTEVHRMNKDEMIWLAKIHVTRDATDLEKLGTLYDTMHDDKRAVDPEAGGESRGT